MNTASDHILLFPGGSKAGQRLVKSPCGVGLLFHGCPASSVATGEEEALRDVKLLVLHDVSTLSEGIVSWEYLPSTRHLGVISSKLRYG